MLKGFFRSIKRLSPLLPLFPVMAGYSLLRKARCDFCPTLSIWPDKATNDPNTIEGRVQFIRYPANDPSEDSIIFGQLTAIPGYFVAVFDGHGGYQMAWYLERHFKDQLEQALIRNKPLGLSEEETVNKSIGEVLTNTENLFLPVLKDLHSLGFSEANRVGTCALVVVVSNNKAYTVSLGDSQAALFSKPKPVRRQDEHEQQQSDELVEQYTVKFLNLPLNANTTSQQDKLKKEFKDKDIVTCFGKNSCYVKGVLQPTRGLGCFGLKDSDLRFSKLSPFTVPYIKTQPIYRSFDLTPEDNYILVASDGLWKDLPVPQIKQVFNIKDEQAHEICESLLGSLLKGVAKSMSLSEAYIRSLPAGARRKAHDDISMVLIDLKKQTFIEEREEGSEEQEEGEEEEEQRHRHHRR